MASPDARPSDAAIPIEAGSRDDGRRRRGRRWLLAGAVVLAGAALASARWSVPLFSIHPPCFPDTCTWEESHAARTAVTVLLVAGLLLLVVGEARHVVATPRRIAPGPGKGHGTGRLVGVAAGSLLWAVVLAGLMWAVVMTVGTVEAVLVALVGMLVVLRGALVHGLRLPVSRLLLVICDAAVLVAGLALCGAFAAAFGKNVPLALGLVAVAVGAPVVAAGVLLGATPGTRLPACCTSPPPQ